MPGRTSCPTDGTSFIESLPAPTFEAWHSSGAGAEQFLYGAETVAELAADWSPDGRFLAYTLPGAGDIWILPLSGDKKPFPFIEANANQTNFRFSPDGRWGAYQSNESGSYEIYVTAFDGSGPASGGKWQISSGGGSQPRWRPGGKGVFYVSPPPDNSLMAVAVTPGESAMEVGSTQKLFPIRLPDAPRSYYQVAPDGQRFLVNMAPPSQGGPPPITVVVNWTAALKK
jgi:Tol biopolymer transport system component